MAIDFDKLSFGNKSNAATGAKSGDAPKAQLWLNIGYSVEVPVEGGGTEERFVSLPQGIPLDTQEPVAVKGKNQEWKAFQAARNDLLNQILAKVAELPAGESTLLNLQIQVRRVNDEEAETVIENNPFAKQLAL
uniref:RNAP1 subunit A n=1 Tax=Erwinia phage Fifi051 TaxID=3238787 RepID=A0AB39ACT5_9CAUD